MSNFDNNMQIILSKVVSDNPNAPHMRVSFEMNGQKYKAGLWLWKRKDGTYVTDPSENKKYKGKIEVDDFVPQKRGIEFSGSGDNPADNTLDDFAECDIPF